MIDPNDDLMTIAQLQEFLQISRTTVYDFVQLKDNPLPVFYLSDRSPRFKKSVVIEWMEQQFKTNEVLKGGE